jgi:micrococcal nuclease
MGFSLAIFAFALWGLWQSDHGGFNASFSAYAGKSDSAANQNTPSPYFGFCHSGSGENCVVDGDTFWFHGEKIRIADIDTPETHPPRCAAEARLGAAATQRLQDLLNAGPIRLTTAGDRHIDRYGRKLRIVERDGASIGSILVAEGLARPYNGGPRAGWCEG